ncbi:hypothetical protein LCGC14_0569620 [marine sediment metagenome]|uniref:Uncharacterized protein n=1 Tax=marine sediment metagenome TaxID=412755 RepID=A0A0F9RJE7_9ZZZZ
MKFKIEHSTDNEKEYKAIMDVIKHYEIEANSQSNEKPCKDKECDYYDVNYPKNCSTSPCSNKEKK